MRVRPIKKEIVMWFITAIVKKTKSHRTFGFFNHYWTAMSAINNNQGDMYECLYDYIILEYIEEGVHPTVIHEEWFEWDQDKHKWSVMNSRPIQVSQTTNWALG